MNAKKIMGAVLVALLAAALFVGAGAATPAPTSGVVFVNQALPATDYGVAWVGANGVFTPLSDGGSYVYFPAGSEGIYTYGEDATKVTITVKAPEVFVSGIAGNGDSAYQFIGGVYYIGTDIEDGKLVVTSQAIETEANPLYILYLTSPNGKELEKTVEQIQAILEGTGNDAPAVGTYSIRAVFNATEFVDGTLYTDRITKAVSFQVAEAGDGTIAASVDQVRKGGDFKVTITGQPGLTYKVKFDANNFFVAGNQLGLPTLSEGTYETFTFEMPNTGSVEFVMTSQTSVEASEKIELLVQDDDEWDKQGFVTIKFTKGSLSAVVDAASYFVGNEVEVTVTNTVGPIDAMVIEGTNFVNSNVMQGIDIVKGAADKENFVFKVNTSEIYNMKSGLEYKRMDVGAYTLTLFVGGTENPSAKATVVIVLKQPFISIIEAPEVIVQDTEAKFIINAEATDKIRYYIFGTNYFNASADVEDLVDDTTNQFTFTLDKDMTKAMDAGQYFMVVQHPMYDGYFNIELFESNGWQFFGNVDSETILFYIEDRQSANAAQALCDALDTQNIDDMYVKYSFFVVGKDASFTISDIPATIAKGETLTISGVSTAAAEDFVTVEMISTAFAAVPKETVGSAAFIAVTAQVAEDGTWEVTLDTSDLNVDEYSLKVACDGQTWKNTKINVVEADEPVTPEQPEEPEQPEQPEEPVAPATPGFGALAALAGLGAVAVLLLRRE